MKAILEFNLPEDQQEFELASNGVKWMLFAYEFSQYLRTEWKYNEDKYTDEQYKILEQIREKFFELMQQEGLELK